MGLAASCCNRRSSLKPSRRTILDEIFRRYDKGSKSYWIQSDFERFSDVFGLAKTDGPSVQDLWRELLESGVAVGPVEHASLEQLQQYLCEVGILDSVIKLFEKRSSVESRSRVGGGETVVGSERGENDGSDEESIKTVSTVAEGGEENLARIPHAVSASQGTALFDHSDDETSGLAPAGIGLKLASREAATLDRKETKPVLVVDDLDRDSSLGQAPGIESNAKDSAPLQRRETRPLLADKDLKSSEAVGPDIKALLESLPELTSDQEPVTRSEVVGVREKRGSVEIDSGKRELMEAGDSNIANTESGAPASSAANLRGAEESAGDAKSSGADGTTAASPKAVECLAPKGLPDGVYSVWKYPHKRSHRRQKRFLAMLNKNIFYTTDPDRLTPDMMAAAKASFGRVSRNKEDKLFDRKTQLTMIPRSRMLSVERKGSGFLLMVRRPEFARAKKTLLEPRDGCDITPLFNEMQSTFLGMRSSSISAASRSRG